MNVAQVAEEINGDVINAMGTDVLEVYYPDDENDRSEADAQNAIERGRAVLIKYA